MNLIKVFFERALSLDFSLFTEIFLRYNCKSNEPICRNYLITNKLMVATFRVSRNVKTGVLVLLTV